MEHPGALELKKFLEVGKAIPSKNSISAMSMVEKRGNRLAITNVKESLTMVYEESDADGVYGIQGSLAFGKLFGRTDTNFPEIRMGEAEPSEKLKIGRDRAVAMLDAFKYVSDDETRYFMNGIHFEDGNVISTDGRRLYLSPGFEGFPNIILPSTKTLSFVLKKCDYIEMSACSVNDKISYIVFSFLYKGTEFQYRVNNIEGQFPNYKKVVPRNLTHLAGRPYMESWNSIYKILKIVGCARSKRILIEDVKDTDFVNILSVAEGEPFSVGTMRWPEMKFDGARLGLNYEYLNDALAIPGIVSVEFVDLTHAFKFNYKNEAFSLLMPMQVD